MTNIGTVAVMATLCLALAGCGEGCMTAKESGKILSMQRSSSSYERHHHPENDTVVVSLQMADGSKRMCKGRVYDELMMANIGDTVTITGLSPTTM